MTEQTAGPQIRAHLVGASGSGMKALGELLADRGWTLTGSDQTARGDFETSAPFVVATGHAVENVPDALDFLIHSPAVRADNPERVVARNRSVPELSYTHMLAQLMRERIGVCIAGTHGKTTTSAMTAFVLRECGLKPSASIGGEIAAYQRSGWWDVGQHLVVESCEYRRHFLDFAPQLAAILNIEADHFDCFPTVDAAREAYVAFAALVPQHGLLVVPDLNPLFDEVVKSTMARVERFSLDSGSDWSATELQFEGPRTRFRWLHHGADCGLVELQVPGRHNVLNALAAAALAHAAGAHLDCIRTALGRFRGTRRRFEIIGQWRGVTVIDDYAHHPTAVSATIQAARWYFELPQIDRGSGPNDQSSSDHRQLIAVFQPHQVSRTLHLLDEFAHSFSGADRMLLMPIYAARESAEAIQSAGQLLFERASLAGAPVQSITSLDHLRTTLEDAARPGDVLLLMGAGDINRIGYELTRSVS